MLINLSISNNIFYSDASPKSMSQLFTTSKRYSPLKFTKSIQQRTQNYSPTTRAFHSKLYTNRYYCHYSNAVYMGGMDSYKKNGFGIVLLDNGTCAITEYSHDNMVEINVVFSDGCLIIITVLKGGKGKYVTYRTGGYLVTVKINGRGVIDGVGYFIDYKERNVYKLEFFGGKVYGKYEILDSKLNQEIFLKDSILNVVQDKNHAKILQMNFDGFGEILCKEQGQCYTFGFYQKQDSNKNNGIQEEVQTQAKARTDKKKIINEVHDHGHRSHQKDMNKSTKRKAKDHNGLHFKLKIINKRQQFDVILEQRGYKIGDKMQKFGQKHFKNGNYYVGGFKNNNFHGFGMLIDPQQKKWTYNVHRNGQISQILQSSVNNNQLKITDVLKKIHENEDSYIKDYIKISPNKSQLSKLLTSILGLSKGEPIKCVEQLYHRKKQNFESIRADFVENHYQQSTQKLIKQELSQQKNKSNSKLKKYINKLELSELSLKNKSQNEGQDELQQESRLNKTFGEKKTTKNIKNNLFSKSKSKSKSNLKLQSNQKNNDKQQQEYNIRITDPQNKPKQKQINQLPIDNNNEKLNKYFKTAQTSHRTHTTTPMNINNDGNDRGQPELRQQSNNNFNNHTDNKEKNQVHADFSFKYNQNSNNYQILNPMDRYNPPPSLPTPQPPYHDSQIDNYLATLPLSSGYYLPDFSPTLQERLAHHRRIAQLEQIVHDPSISMPIPVHVPPPYHSAIPAIYEYQYEYEKSYEREIARLGLELEYERERRERQRERSYRQNSVQHEKLLTNSKRRLFKYVDEQNQKDRTVKTEEEIKSTDPNARNGLKNMKQHKVKQADILIQRYRQLYGTSTTKRS